MAAGAASSQATLTMLSYCRSHRSSSLEKPSAESKGGHAMRGEVRAVRWESVGRRRRKRHARGGPDRRLGGAGHVRGAPSLASCFWWQ